MTRQPPSKHYHLGSSDLGNISGSRIQRRAGSHLLVPHHLGGRCFLCPLLQRALCRGRKSGFSPFYTCLGLEVKKLPCLRPLSALCSQKARKDLPAPLFPICGQRNRGGQRASAPREEVPGPGVELRIPYPQGGLQGRLGFFHLLEKSLRSISPVPRKSMIISLHTWRRHFDLSLAALFL